MATLGVAVALAVTGCTSASTPDARQPSNQGTTDPGPSEPASTSPGSTGEPSTGDSSTPRPTSTIPRLSGSDYDGGAIPTDCKGLMTKATYAKTFAKVPLNDPATVGATPKAPKSAFDPVLQKGGASIYCVWRDPKADITSLSIQVETVNSATAFGELQKLPSSGYTCDRESEGFRCQHLSKDKEYGVDIGDTYFTRGDMGIRIRQANFPTSGLLTEVENSVFGDEH